jgi:hypothetical protein
VLYSIFNRARSNSGHYQEARACVSWLRAGQNLPPEEETERGLTAMPSCHSNPGIQNSLIQILDFGEASE